MTERLFQYIWQCGYYNPSSLSTLEGEPVQVIHPGIFNSNQGPDFTEARIRIGNTTWAGNVELHIRSGDWIRHRHSDDSNYQNVILHVVWMHDLEETLPFPTLVMEDKISRLLLNKYDQLMNLSSFIPCENSIAATDKLTWTAWKERMLIERMLQKSLQVNSWLHQNNDHWEETFWWMIARNFGIPRNADTFEKIAQSIPMNVLIKNKGQIHQLEALLFGQAGMLDTRFDEDYPNMLAREYKFQLRKYQLQRVHNPLHFLRMRPANFPSIRLAQLAMLVHESVHLFSKIIDGESVKEIISLLNVTANDYWHYHYVFDEPSAFKKKALGRQMVENILINTVAPVLFAFGRYHQEDKFKEKAIQWMEALAAEKNNITRGFEALGIECKNAADSQALIRLKKEYCDRKRCLDCAVGNKLLRER